MYACNMIVSTGAAQLFPWSLYYFRRLLCCRCAKILLGMYNKNSNDNMSMMSRICCSSMGVLDTGCSLRIDCYRSIIA